MMSSALANFARERLIRRLLPNGVSSDLNRNDRAGALHRAWGHVFSNQIRGAYYEFWVYRGDSFRTSYRVHRQFARWAQGQLTASEEWRRKTAARYVTDNHQFHAFDTFAGMPPNAETNALFAGGTFYCSFEEFTRLNRAVGLIVDADLYDSARDALEIVTEKLRQGSVLMCDDWNAFNAHRGTCARRALAEWLDRYRELDAEPWFTYDFAGQAFLVHCDTSTP